jgi:hypothetical protein
MKAKPGKIVSIEICLSLDDVLVHTEISQKVSQNNPLQPKKIIEISSDCHQCSSDYRGIQCT